ncbi:hypothetical protein [Caulobacter phage Cr30]|uniref:hypothetical protein n=1 Tax=Caulobacter phage Cr30 TaxID=1357714 RepID=UPI0004A9BAC2|nr:hypothetical protein OZ74_gp211 [Caulobacter phage Cr30]AGS81132.1 hypothetical protein [Caulobacter phage Cr30]
MKRQGTKFPFPSTIDAAYWKISVSPHFSTYSLKENGDGRVGLWNNKFQTWYTFTDKEVTKILKVLQEKDKVLETLFIGQKAFFNV